MLDKFSFTLGVMTISLSQWLILRHPDYFPIFYISLMSLLMIHRYIDYAAIKSELYLLDYCYFVNISVAIQVLFYPDNLLWFQANYVACLGPICIAIIVWNNSLVFHSLDKVTSFFLHTFPPIVMHLHRWKFIKNELPIDAQSSLPLYSNIVLPMAFYALWQITYLFATEVILRNYLQDKSVVISVRALINDKKNLTIKMFKKVLTKHGVLDKNKDVDPDSPMGKALFVCCQATYTIFTILHIKLIYANYYLTVLYIIVIFSVGVWNGASYYVEVFSTRYNLKFKKLENDDSTISRGIAATKNEKISSEDDDDDYEGQHFVEALENLDLNQPENLQLYTNVLGSIVT